MIRARVLSRPVYAVLGEDHHVTGTVSVLRPAADPARACIISQKLCWIARYIRGVEVTDAAVVLLPVRLSHPEPRGSVSAGVELFHADGNWLTRM